MRLANKVFIIVAPGAGACMLVSGLVASQPIWLVLFNAVFIGALVGGVSALIIWAAYRLINFGKGSQPLVLVRHLALEADPVAAFDICLKSVEQFRGLKMIKNDPDNGVLRVHQYGPTGDYFIDFQIKTLDPETSAIRVETKPVLELAIADFGIGRKVLNKVIEAFPTPRFHDGRAESVFAGSG